MKNILKQVNHKDGMTVPEGYFENFTAGLISDLPRQEWESEGAQVLPRSFWQKVRPYVYLAAMFIGVWCMMMTFDLMRPSSNDFSFKNNPLLTAAINNDYFFNDYIINEEKFDSDDLMDDLYEVGFTPVEYSDSDDNDYPMAEI